VSSLCYKNAKLSCTAVIILDVEDDARNSHLLFTVHVYQYRVERTTEGKSGSKSFVHVVR